VISGVFLDDQTLGDVMPLMKRLLLIFLLRAGIAVGRQVSSNALAIRVKSNIRHLLIDHILKLGPAYTKGERTAELTTSAVQGVESLDAYFSKYLPQLVLAPMIPLSMLVFVFPMDLLTGIILLLTAPLIPVFMYLIGKTAEALTNRQWKTLSRLSAHFLDTLQGLSTLKTLNQSQKQGEKISEVSENYRAATINVLRITFLSALVLELVGTLSIAVVAVQIGLRLLYGSFDFQDALFILLIAPEFYLPLRTLGTQFHAGMSGVSAAQKIFGILDQPAVRELERYPKERPIPFQREFELRFKNISFTYPDRTKPALENVSFSIPSGKQTALVGLSGSGKSTILQILLRFIEPQHGEVWINKDSILSLSATDWRENITWISQRPYLFNDTISANIHMGKNDSSMECVQLAARKAHLDAFIESLPHGYETQIGERGARLSAGQTQMLALARAFYKDSPLIIMDEPTAHLDPEHEDLLNKTILKLCTSRTVLLIAHRLPTIMQASQVIFLRRGKVFGSGSHEELSATNKDYHEFITAQLRDR
jgi:thiol reductant ABC exporter CydD subunit